MISVFLGILNLSLFAFLFFTKVKDKWPYLGLGCFAFLMMLGDHAFLYPVFSNYFPLFGSLRFPSVWRCILTIFVLLLTAETLEAVMDSDRKLKRFAAVCFAAGILFYLASLVMPSVFGGRLPADMMNAFRADLKGDSIVSLAYALIFALIAFVQKRKKKGAAGFLLAGIVIDVFVGQACLYSVTVTEFDQWNAQEMEAGWSTVRWRLGSDKGRVHDIEYKDADRTKSGLDSFGIVLGHTLDEEGYLSVSLDYITKYKNSEHCKIAAETPEAYLTNNVVSKREMDYDVWLQDTDVSPYQIYVEEKEDGVRAGRLLEEKVTAETFTSGNISFQIEQEAGGYLVVQQSYYPGWRVYVDGKKEKPIQVNGALLGVYLSEGVHEVTFVFRPADFYIGAAITLLFLFLFACEWVRYFKEPWKGLWMACKALYAEKVKCGNDF